MTQNIWLLQFSMLEIMAPAALLSMSISAICLAMRGRAVTGRPWIAFGISSISCFSIFFGVILLMLKFAHNASNVHEGLLRSMFDIAMPIMAIGLCLVSGVRQYWPKVPYPSTLQLPHLSY